MSEIQSISTSESDGLNLQKAANDSEGAAEAAALTARVRAFIQLCLAIRQYDPSPDLIYVNRLFRESKLLPKQIKPEVRKLLAQSAASEWIWPVKQRLAKLAGIKREAKLAKPAKEVELYDGIDSDQLRPIVPSTRRSKKSKK